MSLSNSISLINLNYFLVSLLLIFYIVPTSFPSGYNNITPGPRIIRLWLICALIWPLNFTLDIFDISIINQQQRQLISLIRSYQSTTGAIWNWSRGKKWGRGRLQSWWCIILPLSLSLDTPRMFWFSSLLTLFSHISSQPSWTFRWTFTCTFMWQKRFSLRFRWTFTWQ